MSTTRKGKQHSTQLGSLFSLLHVQITPVLSKKRRRVSQLSSSNHFLQHFSSILYCMYENYASNSPNSPVFFLQKENHLSVQMDLNNRAKILAKFYNNPNFGSR
ncbi:hypothetical protein L1887_32418 [Cichorium endivia]|nr:hypothetical protein L1887_32418 [Cichorium endivia]